MKIKLTVLLIITVLSARGQSIRDVFYDFLCTQGDCQKATYYSDLVHCGPGEVYQEEIIFYSNMTFLYYSVKDAPSIELVASGKYLLKNKHLFLDYDWVKLDSSSKEDDSFNVNNIKLYTVFKKVNDRKWYDADWPRLMVCGHHMSGFRNFLVFGKNWNRHRYIFLNKRKRLILEQSTTYGLYKEQAIKKKQMPNYD